MNWQARWCRNKWLIVELLANDNVWDFAISGLGWRTFVPWIICVGYIWLWKICQIPWISFICDWCLAVVIPVKSASDIKQVTNIFMIPNKLGKERNRGDGFSNRPHSLWVARRSSYQEMETFRYHRSRLPFKDRSLKTKREDVFHISKQSIIKVNRSLVFMKLYIYIYIYVCVCVHIYIYICPTLQCLKICRLYGTIILYIYVMKQWSFQWQ